MNKVDLAQKMAKRIKLIRYTTGLNQKTFAEKLGVKPQEVNRWEAGKTTISTRMIFEIADRFNLELGVFDIRKEMALNIS